MSLWYFKLQMFKPKLSLHPNQFFLLVSINDTTMCPWLQVGNSDILQLNEHFMGALTQALWEKPSPIHCVLHLPIPIGFKGHLLTTCPFHFYHSVTCYFHHHSFKNLLILLRFLCLHCVALLSLLKTVF